MQFSKYHGTGNDFIIIDDRAGTTALSTEQIAALCHRRFGVGADGLMLLQTAEGYDFGMKYFNSDGRESSMCGNGGRCLVHFAASLGLVQDHARFVAIDGPHEAWLEPGGQVRLAMKDVAGITKMGEAFVLDTGSPHVVLPVQQLDNWNVVAEGRKIRQDARFAPEGTNVNFVERGEGAVLKVRTYERGVEDETLSCGTGVTAAALALATEDGAQSQAIHTPGGQLMVHFHKQGSQFTQVVLEGPAALVFIATIDSASSINVNKM